MAVRTEQLNLPQPLRWLVAPALASAVVAAAAALFFRRRKASALPRMRMSDDWLAHHEQWGHRRQY